MVKKLLDVPSVVGVVYRTEKMTVQTLAKKIHTTERKILNICDSKMSPNLFGKISKRLVKLYCKTKFINEEQSL
jgi:hypothetical protein